MNEQAKKLLIEKLVEIAVHEIETCEEGGNNRGQRVRVYQQATWIAPGPWPWCAAFCCWILQEWLKYPDVLSVLNLSPLNVNSWRCKYPSAFGWEEWADKRNIQILPEEGPARAGDFMVFDMSHIGLVIADQIDEMVYTIEGNTNKKGERDSVTGDGVWPKNRHYTLAKSFIRILP